MNRTVLSGLLECVVPGRSVTRPHYRVQRAATRAEVEAALRLRYEVFNVELEEGLESSHATGKDEDEFDAVCEHLLVTSGPANEVVGTYRMQTGAMAQRHLGYYSAQEFDFSPYEAIRPQLLELGRACVHQDHRTLAVISLLWRAIAEYAAEHGARYLIGCSSLTSQDARLGHAMYRRFCRGSLAPPDLRTVPRPAFALPDIAPLEDCPSPPKLLRTYLGLGARICGPPAMDREFKTIDFLTVMDCRKLPAIVSGHFRVP